MKNQFSRQPIGSSIDLDNKDLPATMSPGAPGLNRSNWIICRAKMVLGSYRRDDFADPDNFLLQLGMILERYSDKVVEAVTSPITGIQRTCKFPPSIAEFVEFCNETMRRMNWSSEYDARSARQLKERDQRDRTSKEEDPEYRRQVIERNLRPLMEEQGFQFTCLGNAVTKILP